MTLIETIGFNMETLFVAKDKILGMHQKSDDVSQTVLIMACGSESEDWIINESILTFRPKFEYEGD
jgi:hypothetical protein